MMPEFKVIPENGIGRGEGPESFVVEAPDDKNLADNLASCIHQEAKKHLMSGHFDVTVNIDDWTFSIGAGRYGSGTIEEVVEDED